MRPLPDAVTGKHQEQGRQHEGEPEPAHAGCKQFSRMEPPVQPVNKVTGLKLGKMVDIKNVSSFWMYKSPRRWTVRPIKGVPYGKRIPDIHGKQNQAGP